MGAIHKSQHLSKFNVIKMLSKYLPRHENRADYSGVGVVSLGNKRIEKVVN